MFNPVFIILLLGMLVLAIVGLVKENRIHMRYKKVFGRVASYLFADFIFVGVFSIIATIISPLIPEVSDMIAGNYLLYAGMGVLVLLLGIAIYLFVRMKCPTYLKKSLFINMLLDGLGIALKISLFFLPFIIKYLKTELSCAQTFIFDQYCLPQYTICFAGLPQHTHTSLR